MIDKRAMQVTVEDAGPVEKKVAVEIPWEDVKKKLDEAYKEIGQHVAIKGFRKGHVPRPVLEKMFGPRLGREIAKQIVEETFPKAMEDRGLHPVAEPVVENDGIHAGQSFLYRARVEVAPEIVPAGYDGVVLVRRVPRITDAMVEGAIERRRQDMAEYRPIEGRDVYRAGDVLHCDLMGKIGAKPFSVEGVQVELGAPGRDAVAGLGAALIGAPLREGEPEVDFEVAGDHPDENLRGAKARLLVTIKDAREKRVADLDDEFAKDTGEADTLDEMRALVRKRIEAAARGAAERALRDSLVKEILARNPFEVSPALVERRLDFLMARLAVDLARQGVDLRKRPEDEERVREKARDGAAESVRASLLLEAIARREGVDVTEADVEKRLAEIAVAQGRGGNVARVRADLEKDGKLSALRSALREEKTLDLLISKATITEEEVAADAATEPTEAETP